MSDPIEKQGQALENQFFARVDQQLLERLRAESAIQEQVAALQAILGISDEAVLKSLVAQGVSAEKAAALRLVPVIMVAWADGSVDSAERLQVREAAQKCEIDPESPAGQLLNHWLQSKPAPELLAHWCDYAQALVKSMAAAEADHLKHTILKQIREVARVSGGILGWGAVTAGESRVMQQVESALTR